MVKVILVGDSGVGKTNLLKRYTRDEFDANNRATIGVDFSAMEYDFKGKTVKVQFWDTAGQEKYRAIAESYYRSAHGALVVFDLTQKRSFEGLSNWKEELAKTGNAKLSAVIVGNKMDLQNSREVSQDEAE